jgi:hypothetical protein
MSEYKILKVPVSKDNTFFYYFKQYKKTGDSLASLPEERTL